MRQQPDTLLRAEGLRKSYPARDKPLQALGGVALDLPTSGFVSIVGPSGCGKSTLLHLLSGMESPDAGGIELDGKPVTTAGQLSGKVALMPQEDLLLPWRTILDNVVLGPVCQGRGLRSARREAAALFPSFGLAGFEDALPKDLSGGMRQRAALMRTFLCERPINLLDEPLGRLDALTRASMQQWLTDYWEQRRTAVVLVTHSIDEALFLADCVYVMSARPGRMLARYEIPFERPRHYLDVVTSREFTRLKRALLEHLEAGRWAPA